MKKRFLIITFLLSTITATCPLLGMDNDLKKEVNALLVNFMRLETDWPNKVKKIKELIQLNADVNTQDKNGITPLALAVKNSDLDLVKFLIAQKNIDVNLQDDTGASALYYAAYNDKNLEIAKLIINHGADILKSDDTGHTPLHIAAGYGNQKMVHTILKTIINPFKKDNTEWQRFKLLLLAIKNNPNSCNLAKLPMEIIYKIAFHSVKTFPCLKALEALANKQEGGQSNNSDELISAIYTEHSASGEKKLLTCLNAKNLDQLTAADHCDNPTYSNELYNLLDLNNVKETYKQLFYEYFE